LARNDPGRHLVLIVGDEADLRALAIALLEKTALEVVDVDSGEAAVAFMQDRGGEVAFLFTDLRLPGSMDGIDLAKAVLKLWPTVKIVVTSGDPGDRLECLPNAITFMPKPWRALDVLVQAAAAVREPPPAVA
jgi:CheY-like chemotaxis protein